MSYIRRKTVAGCVYIYEVAKVKRGRTWVEEIVRYIGPEDPIYGGRGPTSLDEERARLMERRRARSSGG